MSEKAPFGGRGWWVDGAEIGVGGWVMRTDGVLDMGLLRLPVYARCCSPCHPSWEGLGCDYFFLFGRVFSLAARCCSLVVLTQPSLQEKRGQLRFVFSQDGLSGRRQPSGGYADLLLTSNSAVLLVSTFSSCLETAKEDGLSSFR